MIGYLQKAPPQTVESFTLTNDNFMQAWELSKEMGIFWIAYINYIRKNTEHYTTARKAGNLEKKTGTLTNFYNVIIEK